MGRDYNFFRELPGRYLGYCHVVGRVLPDEIVSSSAKLWLFRTTVAYIAFDAVYKAIDNRRPNPVLKAADALIWQGLASLLVPGLAIEGIARGSSFLMDTMKVAKPMNRYIPMGLVLIAMPLFGDVIDRAVDNVLDNTTRPIMLK